MIESTSHVPRFVYGGDRQIGVDVLRFLQQQGAEPLGLLLPEPGQGSHSEELRSIFPYIESRCVWQGRFYRDPAVLEALQSLELDYIVCIHLPTLIPRSVLSIPKHGVLNSHPAFLPYNRGWHSAVWSILDGTPFGATLHFMSEVVDAGDIVHQKALEKRPTDTGDTLYKRALALEFDVFREAWPSLASFSYTRTPQREEIATCRKMKELAYSHLQELDLHALIRIRDLIDRLRALTTNRVSESAFFTENGTKYRIQISIVKAEEREAQTRSGRPDIG